MDNKQIGLFKIIEKFAILGCGLLSAVIIIRLLICVNELFVALLAERTRTQQLDQVIAVQHFLFEQALGDLFETVAVLQQGSVRSMSENSLRLYYLSQDLQSALLGQLNEIAHFSVDHFSGRLAVRLGHPVHS